MVRFSTAHERDIHVTELLTEAIPFWLTDGAVIAIAAPGTLRTKAQARTVR